MDWYPWYFQIYEADTMHLTPYQDGCYRRLIDHYMKTRSPLPDNDSALSRIVGVPLEEWATVSALIRSFFSPKDGKLTLYRCEIILSEQDGRSTKKSATSQKGALNRWKLAKANKEKRHERLSRARSKGTHTKDQWDSLVRFCGEKCVKCSSEDALVKDHIVPIYQGGSDGLDNLQPLCRPCNSSKGAESQDFRPDGWENACQTPAERLLTPSTRQDKTRQDNYKIERPADVTEQIWRDHLANRKAKKQPMTGTALKSMRRQAEKLGWPLQQALEEACNNGWASFKADWVKTKGNGNEKTNGNHYGSNGKSRRTKEILAEALLETHGPGIFESPSGGNFESG